LIASVSAEIDIILIIAFEIPRYFADTPATMPAACQRASFYVFFNDTTQLQIFHADWADCIFTISRAAILRCAMYFAAWRRRHDAALAYATYATFYFAAAALPCAAISLPLLIISWLAIDADTPIIIAIAISFRLLADS
jgi:hypothetical protein